MRPAVAWNSWMEKQSPRHDCSYLLLTNSIHQLIVAVAFFSWMYCTIIATVWIKVSIEEVPLASFGETTCLHALILSNDCTISVRSGLHSPSSPPHKSHSFIQVSTSALVQT